MTTASTPLGQPTTAAQPGLAKPAAAAPASSLGGASLNGGPAAPQSGFANAAQQQNNGFSGGQAQGSYQMGDYQKMIDQYKQTDPAKAWGIYNTLTQQGIGGVAGGLQGSISAAWGKDEARNWVNNMDTLYGGATGFDTKTGAFSGAGNASNLSGNLAGWDPSRMNKDIALVGGGYNAEVAGRLAAQGQNVQNAEGWDDTKWGGYKGALGGDYSGQAGAYQGPQFAGQGQPGGEGQMMNPMNPTARPMPLPAPIGDTGPTGQYGTPGQMQRGGGQGGMWTDVSGQQGRPGPAMDTRGGPPQQDPGMTRQDPSRMGGTVAPREYRGDVSGMGSAMDGMGARGGPGEYQGSGSGGSFSGPGAPGGPGYQYSIGQSGPIQQDIQGSDYYNKASQQAYMDQAKRTLDPQWQQAQADNESKLVNMGLSRGSEAWNREMDNLSRNKNDAYQSAINSGILNAGAEGTRMQGMDLNQGQFHNQAQNQGWTQSMGEAGLRNNAQNMRDQNANQSYSSWSQNQLGNRAADTSAFNAYNNASQGNRGMTLQEQQQQYNMAQGMQMFPYQLQNAAMGYGPGPNQPTYAQYSTPSPGANPSSNNGAGIQNQYAGYSAMGGGMLNAGAGAYNYYNQQPNVQGIYNPNLAQM